MYDPLIPPATFREPGYEAAPDLDAALVQADFVTIHCSKNPETIGMFGAGRLSRMKPEAFLVNTARGGIVDEAALADVLRSGHLAGAGLDVFDPEPPDAAHPLLQLDTVLASPHMAGITVESSAAMALATARNILGVLDGKPDWDNIINLEALRRAS